MSNPLISESGSASSSELSSDEGSPTQRDVDSQQFEDIVIESERQLPKGERWGSHVPESESSLPSSSSSHSSSDSDFNRPSTSTSKRRPVDKVYKSRAYRRRTTRKAKKCYVNVYDAVSGRFRWRPGSGRIERTVDETELEEGDRRHKLTPDEVLHSMYRASLAYRGQTDDEQGEIPPQPFTDQAVINKLPDSTLLEALHYYVGRYYTHHDANHAFRSFDPTALLALGILVEEYIKEITGPAGHLTYSKRGHDVGNDTDISDDNDDDNSASFSEK